MTRTRSTWARRGAELGARRPRGPTRGRGRQQAHLLLELHQRQVGRRLLALQRLEALRQRVALQLAGQLLVGLGLGLDGLDLFGHAVEGIERRRIGQARHRVLDGLLSLGPLLPRNQDVPLALGLFNLVVEHTQLALELLDSVLLMDPLLLKLGRQLLVLLGAGEGLFGQLIVASLHREHGLALPVLAMALLLIPLLFQALFVPDSHRNLFFRLDELRLHVDEDLVEHLLGVLGLGDQIVQVRLDQRP